MKKRLLVYVVLALALSGCTTLKWVPSFEERRTPQVTVSEGRIVVTPEILFYFQDERDFDIVFQLKTVGYSFPDKGIDIDGELLDQIIIAKETGARSVALNKDQKEIVDCKRRSEIEFVCRNIHKRSGFYKYTIRVNSKDGRPPPPRDPPMVNM